VPPGTTRGLAEQYENLHFIFNPEFLTEATAYENMTAPARQIIGTLEDTEEIAKEIMEILPRAQYELICDAEEAEMVKYASNAFYATKVIFFNELFDICEAAKIDYEKIKEALKADPMTGPEHLEIWHKGYRGFGTPEVSKCLPKDVDALIAFSRMAGKYPELLRTVTKINHELAAMTAPKKAE
jgi:UDPglucose 6-dehydrogenase